MSNKQLPSKTLKKTQVQNLVNKSVKVSPTFSSQKVNVPVETQKVNISTQVSPIFSPQINVPVETQKISEPKIQVEIPKISEIITPPREQFYNNEYTFLKIKLKLWIWVLLIILLLIGLVLIILWASGVFSENISDICKSYNKSLENLTKAINDKNIIASNLDSVLQNINLTDKQIQELNDLISSANDLQSLNDKYAKINEQLLSTNSDYNNSQKALDDACTNLDNNKSLIAKLNNFISQADLNIKIEKNINSDLKYINSLYSNASSCSTKIIENNKKLGSTGGTGLYHDLEVYNNDLKQLKDSIYPLKCTSSSYLMNWIAPIIFIILIGFGFFVIFYSTDKDKILKVGESKVGESKVGELKVGIVVGSPLSSINSSRSSPESSPEKDPMQTSLFQEK